MSHSLPRGWALQTHTLHTQPCGARQPLRPPSGRCQSLATDQLPRGEVGGLIQLTRQKVARHLGGRGSLYLPFKALIPSRASLESQNSGRQTDHLFLGGTTQTLQGCVTTPPPPIHPPPQVGRGHLLPLQSPGSPRSTASHSNWEATGFGSKGHFEVKQKVARGSNPDPGPALDCPQAL